LRCDSLDLPGLFFTEAETLGEQGAGSSSSQTDTFRPGAMQLPEAMVEESTNGSGLWFTGNQVTEPLAGAAANSEEFEIGLEFSDEPSDGCLSGCWTGSISIFSDSKTWSSLAMVVFVYSALMCLLWCSPKPQAQSFKFMEVQLVSLNGDANDAGPGLAGSPGATDVQSGAETNAGQNVIRETQPLESKSLPPEKKHDALQNAPLKKQAKPVAVQHKEKPAVAQLQPVNTDSPSQSDTPHEGPGQVAGAGAGPAVSPGAGSPGGNGVDGASSGSVERAFGAPDGPSFLHRVVPSYPVSAKRLEKQGTVLLRVTIDECGRPCQVEVLQKAGFGLDEEAVRAVKESTFVPAKRNGKPLTCKALLPIRFVLKQS
jgi:TonB family protein